MKIVSFFFAFFAVFYSECQHSYYFAEPLPSANNQVDQVAERYFGTYETKDGTISYKFDTEGLTLISTTISSISKATVRESAKYSVRNGYIFGIEKGDSVPCVLEEGYYYFGIRNYDRFIGEGSEHILTKSSTSGTYVLNVFDNGKYVPQLLEFNGKKLEVSLFDYDGEDPDEFGYIEDKEKLPVDNLNLVILRPTEQDFERIASQAFFEEMVLKR